jgi:hypothetical protein
MLDDADIAGTCEIWRPAGADGLTETSTGLLFTAQTLPPPDPLYTEV